MCHNFSPLNGITQWCTLDGRPIIEQSWLMTDVFGLISEQLLTQIKQSNNQVKTGKS